LKRLDGYSGKGKVFEGTRAASGKGRMFAHSTNKPTGPLTEMKSERVPLLRRRSLHYLERNVGAGEYKVSRNHGTRREDIAKKDVRIVLKSCGV